MVQLLAGLGGRVGCRAVTAPHPESGAGTSAPDPRSDRELIAAHTAGDSTAFAALMARHRQRFWNLALRTLRDREDAADALQDGFVRAYRAAPGYRGDAEVASWLHRIVLNVCLARLARRRPTDAAVELNEDHGAPAASRVDDFDRVDARLDVRQLLAALPEEQRLPIVLVELEGHSVADAARLLDLAEGTIKSRCARGRARMAASLLANRRVHQPQTPHRSTTPRLRGER